MRPKIKELLDELSDIIAELPIAKAEDAEPLVDKPAQLS